MQKVPRLPGPPVHPSRVSIASHALPHVSLFSPPAPFTLPPPVYVQFSSDPAHLAPLARGRTAPCFIETRFCRATTQPAAGLKIKYVGQRCNPGKKTIYSKKKKSFCIFRGCRVTNVNFRKVSRDNIRPDFQLGRKEPCSKSLSCIESVLKQKQVQKEINQALNSSMTSSHAELKTKYSISSKWIQI